MITGETNISVWVVVKEFGETPIVAILLATIIILDDERLEPRICIFSFLLIPRKVQRQLRN
jgi:hypothetical protein